MLPRQGFHPDALPDGGKSGREAGYEPKHCFHAGKKRAGFLRLLKVMRSDAFTGPRTKM
jgi:hypothetical protein